MKAINNALLKEFCFNDFEFYARAKHIYQFLDANEHDIILEVGCGSMAHSKNILKLFRPTLLVGLDKNKEYISENIIEKANVLHKEHPNFTFQFGEAENLPFPDKSFDKVIMVEVLEHIHDDLRALQELRRVTREALIISVPNHYPSRNTFPAHFLKFVLKRLPIILQKKYGTPVIYDEEHYTKDIIGHVRGGYNLREIQSLAKKAGLECISHQYVYGFFCRRIINMFNVIKLSWLRAPVLQKLYFLLHRIDQLIPTEGQCLIVKLKLINYRN